MNGNDHIRLENDRLPKAFSWENEWKMSIYAGEMSGNQYLRWENEWEMSGKMSIYAGKMSGKMSIYAGKMSGK